MRLLERSYPTFDRDLMTLAEQLAARLGARPRVGTTHDSRALPWRRCPQPSDRIFRTTLRTRKTIESPGDLTRLAALMIRLRLS